MNRTVLQDCLPWFAALIVLAALVQLVIWVNRGHWNWRRLRALHGDEIGSVQSLSFVLTLPFFVMVIMLIVQVSQLMIATVVVHYAAYAAARSAVVWIPARLSTSGEVENCVSTYAIDPDTAQQYPVIDTTSASYGPSSGGMTYRVISGSTKFEKIAMAAAVALTPICPSRNLGLSISTEGSTVQGVLTRAYAAMAPNSSGLSAVPRRMKNKLAYALANTEVQVRFYHPNSDPPLLTYSLADDYEDFRTGQELGFQDPIKVTINHQLALLPGPGRLLARAASSSDTVAATVGVSGKVYTYPLTASATLGLEGEKPVLTYVEQE